MSTAHDDPPAAACEDGAEAGLYSRFENISVEEAQSIFKGTNPDSLEGDAEVADATRRNRARWLKAWNDLVGGKLGLDPRQTWFHLCAETREAIQACKAFLTVYIKSSGYKRLTLGPEEFEWAYRITSPDSVNTVWKGLIAEADDKILRPMRIRARKDKKLAGQAKFWRLKRGKHGHGAHDEGIVSSIANWIYGDLAKEFGLKPIDYEKVPLTAADVLLFIRTLWLRADDIPCSLLARVSMHASVLLLGVTGWRRQMGLGIKFSQIKLAMVRDPLDQKRKRLEARVTAIRNKQRRGTRRKGRSSKQVAISLTDIPSPLLCLAGLVVASAITQGAFQGDYASVDELLNRPNLEDVDYVPLGWKNDFKKKKVFPISEALFGSLWQRTWIVIGCRTIPRTYALRIGFGVDAENGKNGKGVLRPAVRNFVLSQTSAVFEGSYQPERVDRNLTQLKFKDFVKRDTTFFKRLQDFSLTVDPNAPIYPSEKHLQEIECRNDLNELKAKHGDKSSKVANYRRNLRELSIQLCRKEYFLEADQLRAEGRPTDHLRVPLKPPRPVSWEHMRLDMSMLALPKRSELAGKKARKPKKKISFATGTAWYVNYLRKNWAAIELPPPGSPVTKDRPTCLCCGANFSERRSLTRHCKDSHVGSGLFDGPYECPECIRLDFPDRVVRSPPEWSNHVEKVHGKLHAPNLPGCSPSESNTIYSQKPSRRCLICNEAVEGMFERHFYRAHVAPGHFAKVLSCPECQRQGLRDFPIDGQDEWFRHAAAFHGERLRVRCLLCSEFFDSVGLQNHFIRKHTAEFPLPCPECTRIGVAHPPVITNYDMWRVHVIRHEDKHSKKQKRDDNAGLDVPVDSSRCALPSILPKRVKLDGPTFSRSISPYSDSISNKPSNNKNAHGTDAKSDHESDHESETEDETEDETESESDEESDDESDEESDEESDDESDEESDEESDDESDEESDDESDDESDEESDEKSDKESDEVSEGTQDTDVESVDDDSDPTCIVVKF